VLRHLSQKDVMARKLSREKQVKRTTEIWQGTELTQSDDSCLLPPKFISTYCDTSKERKMRCYKRVFAIITANGFNFALSLPVQTLTANTERICEGLTR